MSRPCPYRLSRAPQAHSISVCTIHEQSFKAQWSAGQMPNGRTSYARLLAMCALSTQRILSGASSGPSAAGCLSLQVYLDDALTAVSEHHEVRELESLQAVHLLSVTVSAMCRRQPSQGAPYRLFRTAPGPPPARLSILTLAYQLLRSVTNCVANCRLWSPGEPPYIINSWVFITLQ